MRLGHARFPRNVYPSHALVKTLLPLKIGRIVLAADNGGFQLDGRAIFANVGDVGWEDECFRSTWAKSDIVQCQIISNTARGVILEGERDRSLPRGGCEGKAVRIPFLIIGNIPCLIND